MAPPQPQPVPLLPDEMLEEIFLRLDAAEDLARTSAACTTFRRVVSAHRFLRRFRSLHAAPVLGLVGFERGFHAAEPPHRSAPAARALEQAADFIFSFLPDPGSWRVCDARDGRVLLYKTSTVPSCDLVVCDPLYRRYVQIPSIPEEKLSSVAVSGEWVHVHQIFLAPVGDDDESSSIRVIYNVMSESKFAFFVFSSVTGEWSDVPAFNHRLLDPTKLCRFYARGCFYGLTYYRRKCCLMLDLHAMNFSEIQVRRSQPQAIVDVGENKLGLLTLGPGNRTLELYCKNWQNNGVGDGEWQHDKSIPLPEPYDLHIVDAAEGCLLLKDLVGQHYFTLNLKTLLVESLCTLNEIGVVRGPLYAGFPPSFSPPSI